MADLRRIVGAVGGGLDVGRIGSRRVGDVDVGVLLGVHHAQADVAAPALAFQPGHQIAGPVVLVHLEGPGPVVVLGGLDRADRPVHPVGDPVQDTHDGVRIAGDRDQQSRDAQGAGVVGAGIRGGIGRRERHCRGPALAVGAQ